MAARKTIALGLEYPLALRGGVSVLVETLLEGLKPHYDLILISPDNPEALADQPAGALISGHVPWNPATVSPLTARALAQELARQRVNLAHFHFGGVFGWGNRFPGHCPIPYLNTHRIPAFSTVHLVVNLLDGYCGPRKPLWFKLAMLPLAWISKLRVLASVRHEIAVSHHDEQKLRRWYAPQRGKFLQLYHSRLRADAQPVKPVPRAPLILNVGHIAWRKGQLVLVKAFAEIAARYPEWKLCLAGGLLEPGNVDAIRNVARERGIENRVELPGERQDAMDLMRRAGVYVQPSYFEALGLALQEAMFVGCPGIGTRAGGIPELITHEDTGLLVEPGDVTQLAAALEKMIANPALREKYGQRGATSIVQKGMTAERMISRHIELYESALARY